MDGPVHTDLRAFNFSSSFRKNASTHLGVPARMARETEPMSMIHQRHSTRAH